VTGAVAGDLTGRSARRQWTFFIAALVLPAALATGLIQTSHADTVIDSTSVEYSYPTQLIFKVTAHADTQITDVALSYELAGESSPALARPEGFSAAKSVNLSVAVPVNSSSSYIPVGSEFTYHWEVTTTGGAKFDSPDQTFVFLPPDQQWQTLSNEFMTIYYHSGISDIAAKYLAAGTDTYATMGKLLGATLTLRPVRVVIFNTEGESARARPAPGGTVDAAVNACGSVPAPNVILILPNACATSDMTDTLRHELTHILAAEASGNALGQLPAWLDEGTALNGQLTPGPSFTGAFANAAKADALLPFDTMTTTPIDLTKTNLFYGQSYAMVKFLADQGAEKFATYFATMKQGISFDAALQQVYGYDVSGFEAAFRTANGLPAQSPPPTPPPTISSAGATPGSPGAPTAAPATSSSSGISRTTVAILALALLFLLLAVLAYLLLMVLQNRRREPRV